MVFTHLPPDVAVYRKRLMAQRMTSQQLLSAVSPTLPLRGGASRDERSASKTRRQRRGWAFDEANALLGRPWDFERAAATVAFGCGVL
jgi:hypothetical protein